MARLDPFTRRRLEKFVEDHRASSGQLPTRKDLGDHGFGDESVKAAIRDEVLEEYYVKQTNGTIVKGYKLKR